MTATELLDAAIALPEDERADLAYQLLQSLKPPGLSEDDPGYFEELQRRSDAYDADPSSGFDWEDVYEEMKRELRETTW